MEIIKETIEQLKEFAEKIVEPSDDISYYRVIFSAASNADYYFVAYIYDDGEPQITAKRLGADEDELFWCYPFESPDYKSTAVQHQAFIDKVLLLLRHATRIVQYKGLLFGGFTCEYFQDEEWLPLYSYSYFRFSNFRPPKLNGKEMIYTSGAVFHVT
jgi:hypothetical protein